MSAAIARVIRYLEGARADAVKLKEIDNNLAELSSFDGVRSIPFDAVGSPSGARSDGFAGLLERVEESRENLGREREAAEERLIEARGVIARAARQYPEVPREMWLYIGLRYLKGFPHRRAAEATDSDFYEAMAFPRLCAPYIIAANPSRFR